ncbi:cathepsin B-like cysteine proteinase 4 isoform X1 [Zophobas morio]|uniref:cathepsin B-like cysteine proteinase 4 isoform X1 n=1 Tax=Zophobas morio TaxID=2755281 RepID=UPI0030834A48
MEHNVFVCALMLFSSCLAQNTLNSHEEIIEFINSNQSSWTAGVNLAGKDLKDLLPLFNGVRGLHPDLNFTIPQMKHNLENITLPSSFDARSIWPQCADIIGNILNQGHCGSCWAFATTEVMSDRLCIQSSGKVKMQLSAEDVVSCCSTCGYQCQGGYPSTAFQYWDTYGVVSGGDYLSNSGCKPYGSSEFNNGVAPECQQACSNPSYKTPYNSDKHFGSNYYQVSGQESQIQAEIYTKGAVSVVFTVYEDFPYYQTGIYFHIYGVALGLHAVKIIGWGTEFGFPYWLVANSWGKSWGGLGGYFKILRGYNHCGIEEQVLGADSRVYSPNPEDLNNNDITIGTTPSSGVKLSERVLLFLLGLFFLFTVFCFCIRSENIFSNILYSCIRHMRMKYLEEKRIIVN